MLSLPFGYRSRKAKEVSRSLSLLAASLRLAETLQALTQLALQGLRRVWIEGHEVPQRLSFVFAEISQCRGIGVRVTRHVFANGAIGMVGQFAKGLCVSPGMLANQAQKIEVFL